MREIGAISIHAAREGGDLKSIAHPCALWISIHAAREGGDKWGPKSQAGFDISIHAAREGGDAYYQHFLQEVSSFQSTPPVKAATLAFCPTTYPTWYFNPRRP